MPETNLPGGEVEPDRFVEHGARSRETCERLQVDVRIVAGVVTGDESRKHPRIRRLDDARDQRHSDTRQRTHAEVLQHGDVGVTAAEEDEILEDRQRTCK